MLFESFLTTSTYTFRGFIEVLNKRATEFDTWAKNWQGLEGLAPLGGSRGMLLQKILKFYRRRDGFSCILKLQTMTFNNQRKITFLDNLIMIDTNTHHTNWTFWFS